MHRNSKSRARSDPIRIQYVLLDAKKDVLSKREVRMDVKSGQRLSPGRKICFQENEIIRFSTFQIQLDMLEIDRLSSHVRKSLI